MLRQLCLVAISAALLPVTLCASSTQGALGPTFAQPKVYRIHSYSYPRAIAVGDLNGDGKRDIAVTSLSAVTVSLNNGGARFTERAYSTGSEPVAVAIADVSGDHRPDLVTADSGARGVSVLLNAGTGTFRRRVAYATARRPFSVGVADVNGDGALDLATANDARPGVSILLNKGAATFGPSANYEIGHPARSIAIGDLNGDRRADLAAADGRVISFLWNAGGGRFSRGGDYKARGWAPREVALVDVTGDRKLDLLTSGSDSVLSVLVNQGDATFRARHAYSGAGGRIATGD